MRRFVVLGILCSLFILGSCGRASANDQAVCDSYQHLVDIWPTEHTEEQQGGITITMYSAVLLVGSSEPVFMLAKKVESAEAVYSAITDAGLAVISAAESADSQELREEGEAVGRAASSFIKRNRDLLEKQVIPIFSERLIAGERLNQMCEGIGHPIVLPENKGAEK